MPASLMLLFLPYKDPNEIKTFLKKAFWAILGTPGYVFFNFSTMQCISLVFHISLCAVEFKMFFVIIIIIITFICKSIVFEMRAFIYYMFFDVEY